MIWEASDENCKNIEVAGEKIVEISNGWHIDNVVYSDRTSGKDMKFLIIEIRKDSERAWQLSFLLGIIFRDIRILAAGRKISE